MRYLVVLKADSPVGRLYTHRSDAMLTGGETVHPILDCSEIDTLHPRWLFLRHEPARAPNRPNSMFVPHEDVLLIHQYAEGDPPPFGFLSGDQSK